MAISRRRACPGVWAETAILYRDEGSSRDLSGASPAARLSAAGGLSVMALNVVVSGTGFMGREVLAAIAREPDLEPVGIIEKFAAQDYMSVPGLDGLVPMS